MIMIACVAFLAISDLGKIASDSYRRWIRDPRVIRDYLESHSVRKLQLGAGGNDPTGWLNTDIVPTRDEVYLDRDRVGAPLETAALAVEPDALHLAAGGVEEDAADHL